MSLDQAFLRAYAKQQAAPKTARRIDGPHVFGGPAVPAAPVDDPHSLGTWRPPSPDSAREANWQNSGQTPGGEAARPASTTDASRPKWEPAWQVDAFGWSEVCQRLDRELGTQLAHLAEHLLALARQGRRVLAVGSGVRGEGRSTLALALARQLARVTSEVALVDADFAHSTLADQLGLAPTQVRGDLLSGAAPLSEIMIESMDDHLALLPASDQDPDLEPMAAAVWESALIELRRRYRLVLLDVAPTSEWRSRGRSRLPGWWLHVDAALLVHDQRGNMQDCDEAQRWLRAAGIEPWGVIANFAA